METLKLQLTIDRTVAILAGKSTHGTVEVPLTDADLVEMSDQERQILANLPTFNNVLSLDGIDPRIGHPAPKLPPVADATLPTIRKLLLTREQLVQDQIKQREQRQKEALAQWVTEALAADDQQWLVGDPGREQAAAPGYYSHVERSVVHADPRIAPKLAKMQEQADERNQAYREKKAIEVAERERRNAERETEEKRQVAARAEQIRQWVLDHGTPGQKARQERGLLPEKEIVTEIADRVFSPLAEWDTFELITEQDIFESYSTDMYSDTAIYDDWPAEEATDNEFSAVEKIEQALHEYQPTVSLHVYRGRLKNSSEEDDEEFQVIRKAAIVKVTVGEITIERRFAV
ncbi:hypothetical protein [Desulfobulbus alkaliphilus]|uniref:hypothetical protein n=1 Tax=Desulfobulbus alkaliphilus TaxID=869814 RepID=UPI0019635EBC|nr:hypothetical protein [Desulfobulbus alkaliphilus]MBM9536163.1 hypothetical protein [Desulfobulbus alkaliphilus]